MAAKSDEKKNDKKKREEEWRTLMDKFDRAVPIGDPFLLFQSWSAWSVLPEKKRVALISRVVLGDDKANILFDRNVSLSGLADLLREIANMCLSEITKSSKMPEFKIDIPGPENMVKNLKRANESISAAIKIIDSSDFLQRAKQ